MLEVNGKPFIVSVMLPFREAGDGAFLRDSFYK